MHNGYAHAGQEDSEHPNKRLRMLDPAHVSPAAGVPHLATAPLPGAAPELTTEQLLQQHADSDEEAGGQLGLVPDDGISYKHRPRRKATERPTGADQVRQSFSKRKKGLALKAYQLGQLTDAKVFCFIVNDKGSSWAYATPGFGAALAPGHLKTMRRLAGADEPGSRQSTEIVAHPVVIAPDQDDRHLFVAEGPAGAARAEREGSGSAAGAGAPPPLYGMADAAVQVTTREGGYLSDGDGGIGEGVPGSVAGPLPDGLAGGGPVAPGHEHVGEPAIAGSLGHMLMAQSGASQIAHLAEAAYMAEAAAAEQPPASHAVPGHPPHPASAARMGARAGALAAQQPSPARYAAGAAQLAHHPGGLPLGEAAAPTTLGLPPPLPLGGGLPPTPLPLAGADGVATGYPAPYSAAGGLATGTVAPANAPRQHSTHAG